MVYRLRDVGTNYAEILDLGAITDEGVALEPLTGAALIRRAEEVLAEIEPEDDRKGKVFASSGSRRGFGDREPMAAAGRVWNKSRGIGSALKHNLRARKIDALPSRAQRPKKP